MIKRAWPEPILLTGIVRDHEFLDLPQWDALRNKGDQRHLLPIVTPVYPCQNCSFNVTQTTKAIIFKELVRAHRLLPVTAVPSGGAPGDEEEDVTHEPDQVRLSLPLSLSLSPPPPPPPPLYPPSTNHPTFSNLLPPQLKWKFTLLPTPFFTEYKQFLQVKITADTEPEILSWEGFCNARLRFLFQNLEKAEGLKYFRPFPGE